MTEPQDQSETAETTDVPPAALAEDALVEEVSIDGMCGVY